MKSKTHILFIILAILMLIPCYFSITGLWVFYTYEKPTNTEGLIIMGFMAFYSLALVIPYLISLIVFHRKLSRKFLALTTFPYVLMAALSIYGNFIGIPW